MTISIFELFSVGIGPSSSHTVGPMRAAKRFLENLAKHECRHQLSTVSCELYGSLGHTGKGHGSDKAVILGLLNKEPETIDTDTIPRLLDDVRLNKKIVLENGIEFNFDEAKQIIFHRRKSLPLHPNGMEFHALDAAGNSLMSRRYYSVGGGFVINEHDEVLPLSESANLPFLFNSADELLNMCNDSGLSIATLMLENEKTWQSETDIRNKLLSLWHVMDESIERGCQTEGILPGGLKVQRRAPGIYRKLKSENNSHDPMHVMDWVDLFALAVNEENAAGGRIVTAPTNGAAGILPAVIKYYLRFHPNAQENDVVRFFLTAGAIGLLYKMNASISGAEVGCQGEVGVACSMAAAGLAELMGGSPAQIENAAEIGMEHNLGLTCDPVGGLVQVPCIERNAMGAVKAINASRLALRGDGKHKVSLDKVIKTMRQTGADMKSKYKETARGGLAVNIIEC